MSVQPSPIKAIESAWKDMVAVLFSPFDYAKWLVLGLPLFLIHCGSGGGGFNGNPFGGGGPGGGPGGGAADEVVQWVDQNLALIWAIIAGIILFIVVLTILVSYLQARGIFMLINILKTGIFNLGVAWSSTTRLAHSFFLYTLTLTALSMGPPLLYVLLFLGWPFVRGFLTGQSGWPEIMSVALVFGIFWLLVWLPLTILNIVVRNFAIPVMAATDQKVIPATKEAFGLLFSSFGTSLLYLVLLFVMSIGSSIIMIAAAYLLCCLIIGCIPFVGNYAVAVVTAPVSIFIWTFCLRFVEQFGDRYKILPDDVGVPPAPPLPTFQGEMPPPSAYGSSMGGQQTGWPPAPMPPMHSPTDPGTPPPLPPMPPPQEPPRE
jgi:hypothetical protein